MTSLRLQRSAGQQIDGTGAAATRRGDLVVAGIGDARRLAVRLDAGREPGNAPISAGDLAALALLHQIFHLAVERYATTVRPGLIVDAAADLDAALGRRAARAMAAYGEQFPPFGGADEPADERLEELLLTRVTSDNPALGPLRSVVADAPLDAVAAYRVAAARLESFLGAQPAVPSTGLSLAELLRAPARAHPTSLAGQLRYIREHWRGFLGDELDRLAGAFDLTLDVIAEEARGLHLRFGGGQGGGSRGEAPSFGGLGAEPERFSMDRDWMPRVVLMAKSTYVWLDQLARQHGRDIRTLDAVPDEELERLARAGVTALWLIGLWQRSRASERIKRMRGNPEAVASAYSLDEYRIADDLGGEPAWAALRDRAWVRGIRLASDMVPNHMGIDSHWVIEHPERFMSLGEPPYPAYSYTGPDLSDDGRAAIRIEDHYWDGTDAAVVFQRVDTATGDVRYIYHGNDGTSMPWNDTAQLDYLDPAVREVVIRTILDVARRFPIIRFDAAMTLARKHIQRLWYPVPGSGGAIASRAEHAVPQAAFDAAMPHEFWRDVVDRVAAEAPDTLLLAEAFWLMEGYFVRTLGMHRVYNSAFMHMLRDEDNAGYRSVIKNTLEFDPEILKRYVNFMNNPDERTAVEQFGKGDKYFGVATLMATLPGLPMLGHGQIEGYGEKYGMEYRRAYHDETPDPWLVERHERELFPLLHERARFAEARDFLLYDLLRDDGSVDEDVFAYSNGRGPWRSLVVYHNRYAETAGTIRLSAAYSEPDGSGGRRLVRRSLADGWGLGGEDGVLVRWRDRATGMEHLQRIRTIHERGLRFELRAYERHVLMDVAEVRDGVAGLWGRLADRLGGGGVPSLDQAFRDLELEPVHAPVRHLLDRDVLAAIAAAMDGPDRLSDGMSSEIATRFRAALVAVREATGSRGGEPDDAIADLMEGRLLRLVRLAAPVEGAVASTASADARISTAGDTVAAQVMDAPHRIALIVWALLEAIGRAGDADDVRATARAWLDELRLLPVVADAGRAVGLDESSAWQAAERVRLLISLPRSLVVGGSTASRPAAVVELAIGNEDIRRAIRVNHREGVEWVEREAFEALIDAGVALDAIDAPWLATEAERGPASIDLALASSMEVAASLKRAGEAAGYRVDRLVAMTARLSTPGSGGRADRATGTRPGKPRSTPKPRTTRPG